MKVVDLSHVMNVHTPGWVGYAGNKMYYAQNLQTQMIVAQRYLAAASQNGSVHYAFGGGSNLSRRPDCPDDGASRPHKIRDPN
jgi:hypothetical protein